MDNTSEKTQASNLETQGSAEGAPLTVGTRRRFTRNAVAGSAVLLSLGNRAAWADQIGTCMSTPLFHSLTPTTYIASAHPQQDLADQILREGAPPNQIVDFDDNQTCSVLVDLDGPVGDEPACSDNTWRTVDAMRGIGSDACADADPAFPDKLKRTMKELRNP